MMLSGCVDYFKGRRFYYPLGFHSSGECCSFGSALCCSFGFIGFTSIGAMLLSGCVGLV
jgi:hypothetical protein